MKYCKDWVMAKLMQDEQMARMTTISPEICRLVVVSLGRKNKHPN